MVPLFIGVACLAVGFAAGFFYRKAVAAQDAQSIEARAQKRILEADREAEQAAQRSRQEAKEEASELRRVAEDDVRARRDEVAKTERRIAQQEEQLDRKVEESERRRIDIDEREEKLAYVRQQLERATDAHRTQLERIAQLTTEEARRQLMAEVVDDAKRSAMTQVREIEQRAREEGEERARKIVTIAIQRVASEQTAESTVSVFALPSEDMKGRIIGREGRNIRAFEATTGVNLIIDDTGGGGAVVVRPGATRGREDEPGEARGRWPNSSRENRGGP